MDTVQGHMQTRNRAEETTRRDGESEGRGEGGDKGQTREIKIVLTKPFTVKEANSLALPHNPAAPKFTPYNFTVLLRPIRCT